MKKVLALVLAVIMVCTMAMAVTVVGGIGSDVATGATTAAYTYTVKAGGSKFFVVLAEKNHLYFEDGKFIPAKNVVKVEYAAGADLVASEGWVKLADRTGWNLAEGIVESSDGCYQYQIALKNDITRTADGKSFDFSISKITLTATGWEPQTLWEADEDTKDVVKFDIGYKVVDIDVAVSSTTGLEFTPTAGAINRIASIVKDGKTALDSATLKVDGTSNVAGKAYAKGTLNKGASFFVLNNANAPKFVKADNSKDAELTTPVAKIENIYNLPMTGVLEQTAPNAAKLYKVYAKGIDGKVASVAATLDNGVLKFNVPALSTVIVTTDSLTVTASTTTPAGTGSTTNPGTGANDVVGVAAALAVVALVSGAAISLKK